MDKIVKVGRRKTSVARVFLAPAANSGQGIIKINKRGFEEFFPVEIQRIKMMEPFGAIDVPPTNFDITVNVRGGGITGQAEAVRLGVSRALTELNLEYRPALKKLGLLTRDSRMVERKKYGRPKARKKFQFSKR